MKGADQCPLCGSDEIWFVRRHKEQESEGYAACRDCGILWEPFDPADIWDPDDEYSPFKVPCNNCAFRGDSPERANPEKWANLVAHIESDPYFGFICHKGVPLSFEEGESHAHPKTESGVVDVSRSRFCRGWMNMRKAMDDRAMRAVRKMRESHD